MKATKFETGMYLFETLTAGMYNDPLAIYREYIQNSVDSIDMLNGAAGKAEVRIELKPREQKIIIQDNGYGISSNNAERILYSFGDSDKIKKNFRGFRGIGRLGGIAFSDKAIFQTKADGEKIESTQIWDCKKLRSYLNDPIKEKLSLSQIVQKISKFDQTNGKKASGGYFNVTLEGVTSFRNYIFDINRVRAYLAQIAPVPFDSDEFSYGQEIEDWLASKMDTYRTYNIYLNNHPIYKPYKDFVKITKTGSDDIEGIQKIEIKIKEHPVAFGWIGKRKSLLGAIAKGHGASGIRVRVGNILIGDGHLLDGCFRETRFNSYIVGEIHVDCPHLIPNSRRDDFVDNEYKTLFYNAVEREIGFTLSKEIRRRSRECSTGKEKKTKQEGVESYEALNSKSDTQVKESAIEPKQMVKTLINEIKQSCSGCKKSSDLLNELNELCKII